MSATLSGSTGSESNFVRHPPIRIDGNDPPCGLACGIRGGAGTPDDPFLIEGWDIVPGDAPGIHVVNSSYHIKIRRNWVHDGDRRLPEACLWSPTGGSCAGADLLSQVGIVIEGSANVAIEENRVEGNLAALRILHSNGTTVVANVVRGDAPATLAGAVRSAADGAVRSVASHVALLSSPPRTHAGIVVDESDGILVVGNRFEHLHASPSAPSEAGFSLFATASSAGAYDNVVANGDHGFSFEGSDAEVARNHFVDLRGVPLFAADSRVDAFENRFEQTGAVVACGNDGSLRLVDNRFTASGVFSHATNPYCPGEDLVAVVARNTFDQSFLGMSSRGLVEANVFTGGTGFVDGTLRSALIVQSFDPVIRGNRILGSEVGIATFESGSDIRANTVLDTTYAVLVQGTKKPQLACNDLDRATFQLYNLDARFRVSQPPGVIPVQATHNWWGSPDGPPPDKVVGAAEVAPWSLRPCAG